MNKVASAIITYLLSINKEYIISGKGKIKILSKNEIGKIIKIMVSELVKKKGG